MTGTSLASDWVRVWQVCATICVAQWSMIAQLKILQTYYLLLNDTERISIDFCKTNTKLFTTTSQKKGNYHNELVGIQRLPVALKNAINQVAIGFRLKSYWLERKLAFSGPITEQNKKKNKANPCYFRYSILKICSHQRNQKDKTKQKRIYHMFRKLLQIFNTLWKSSNPILVD